MYIIVCLKDILKPELKYISTSKYFVNLVFNSKVSGYGKNVF